MQSGADDIYSAGTMFSRLYGLFKFDRELRQTAFNYLIQTKAALKTATIYAFCEKHRGCSDHLVRPSLFPEKDSLTPRAFRGNETAPYSKKSQRLNEGPQ